jgi:molybdate transport system substrate-binding protein
MIKLRYIYIFCFLALLSACSDQGPKFNKKDSIPLTISAAASLHDVLLEIEKEYIKDQPNQELIFNFGGSGALMQQIEKGAPVDLFIFADSDKSNQLLEKGLVEKNTVSNFLGNQLVLIAPKETKQPLSRVDDLVHTNVNKIAIGTPESVPAGLYSKQALQSVKIWDKLEGKLVFTKDVRQVLTYVEMGNVDAGFVYMTDAIQSRKIKIVSTIPDSAHEPIVYTTGIIQSTKHSKEAKEFSTFLLGEKAKQIFIKYGFIVLE